VPRSEGDGRLTPDEVGRVLGISGDTVRRIPRTQLPYDATPGEVTGSGRYRQRRYRHQDVQAYARTYLGRDVEI
jgi:hypothetical protein